MKTELPNRNREEDLLRVCDMFIGAAYSGSDFMLWGIDSKRPFGNSIGGGIYEVLEELEIEMEDYMGDPDVPGGSQSQFSSRQEEYAQELMDEAPDKIEQTWKTFRNKR